MLMKIIIGEPSFQSITVIRRNKPMQSVNCSGV